jgi:hypothetical protein
MANHKSPRRDDRLSFVEIGQILSGRQERQYESRHLLISAN